MSAIGSVIMSSQPFSLRSKRRDEAKTRSSWFEGTSFRLPGALGDAGQLAGVGHLPHADAAESEHAVDRAGPAASRASGVSADAELRLASGLGDHRLGSHGSTAP